ncbi:MAG: hypothetical protein V1484_00585 [bacterium]
MTPYKDISFLKLDGNSEKLIQDLNNKYKPKTLLYTATLVENNNNMTVAKYQVEEVGLDWSEVSEKLKKNAWVKQISSTGVRLTANLDVVNGLMTKIFGDNFSKILPILQQSHNNNSIFYPLDDYLNLLSQIEEEILEEEDLKSSNVKKEIR